MGNGPAELGADADDGRDALGGGHGGARHASHPLPLPFPLRLIYYVVCSLENDQFKDNINNFF